jgi:hypothetical protein
MASDLDRFFGRKKKEWKMDMTLEHAMSELKK